MMSGLRPIHSVDTITCTSEMSGTASSGVAVIAQMPQSVRAAVPVNTRNRLPAHQSMIRLITVLLCGDWELLRRHVPAAALHHDGRVPRAGHHHLARPSVGAVL